MYGQNRLAIAINRSIPFDSDLFLMAHMFDQLLAPANCDSIDYAYINPYSIISPPPISSASLIKPYIYIYIYIYIYMYIYIYIYIYIFIYYNMSDNIYYNVSYNLYIYIL